MKICSKCKTEKDEAAFSKKRKDLDSQCKECRAEYQAIWYSKNRQKRIEQVSRNVSAWRRRKQALTDEIKNRPCADCGNTYPPYVMDFDHVRGNKEFNIGSQNAQQVSIDRLQKEIEKCDIVCSNCHRIRTFNRRMGM